MHEHQKNRHNIGIPARYKRGKSATVKRNPIENESLPDKLPSLIGEHKKFQDLVSNGTKINVQSQKNQIDQIDEEDHDWMVDSLGEFGSEAKSPQRLRDR